MKYKFKTKPYPFQLKVLKLAIKKKKYCLWLDPGLGKTKIALDFCGYYYLKEGINHILIVCPLSVIGVWEDEITTHLPDYIERAISVKTVPQNNGLQFLITTYQYLVNHEKEFVKWKPQVLIIDEAHYIKSRTAKRSKAVKRLARNIQYQLQLTGTPQPKDYLDLWNQLDTLHSGVLGKWSEFKAKHAVFDYFGFRIVKWLNLNDLRERIRPYRVRVRKEDVLDLPSRTHQRVPIDLEKSQREVYDKLKLEAIVKLSEQDIVTADIILTQILRLQQLTGGFTVTEDKAVIEVGKAKLKVLEEILPTYTSNGKVVVFCRFLWELNKIIELCKELNLNPVWIRGKMSNKQRTVARETFQNDPRCKVIVCQITAGGIGITLHAANTAIFYSLTYKLDDYTQACDRIHRIGQDKPCLYLYLVARNTIDNEIFQTLRNKQRLADVVTDNWREVLK